MSTSFRALHSSEAPNSAGGRPTSATSTLAPHVDPRGAPYAVWMLRVALGLVFLAHAYAKVAVFTLPGTVAFFADHGFPGWTAYPVFVAELAGGVALIAGAYARWAAIGLVPVMLGALTVHWPNGWSFTAPDGGWEYVAFLIVMLLVQALAGDDAFALRRSPWLR